MLEGTDAKVYFVHDTRGMEEARSRELRMDSFVRLEKLSAAPAQTDLIDLGDAERLLKDRRFLGDGARESIKRGMASTEEGWEGWLEGYRATLCKTVREITEVRAGSDLRERTWPMRRVAHISATTPRHRCAAPRNSTLENRLHACRPRDATP
jgi:hypothetical protein